MRRPEPYARTLYEPIAADGPSAAWIGLSWGAGGGHVTVTARLVSIRIDGISLTCGMSPPLGRRVQVCLDTRSKEHTAEATVAAVRDLPHGLCLVRLIFVAPCGRAFRRAAKACLDSVQ
jgi:hypothetical protein